MGRRTETTMPQTCIPISLPRDPDRGLRDALLFPHEAGSELPWHDSIVMFVFLFGPARVTPPVRRHEPGTFPPRAILFQPHQRRRCPRHAVRRPTRGAVEEQQQR